MTILLDDDNKTILSVSSGGFKDKTLNTVEYNGDMPEDLEGYYWDEGSEELKNG